jgi:hypothetical protein
MGVTKAEFEMMTRGFGYGENPNLPLLSPEEENRILAAKVRAQMKAEYQARGAPPIGPGFLSPSFRPERSKFIVTAANSDPILSISRAGEP